MPRSIATRIAAGLVVVTAGATALQAHHSITAAYDSAKPVTVTGAVRAFHFVNPHPWVELVVRAEGREDGWRLELDNRFELVALGMSADTIRAGDGLVVTGSPSREAARSLYVRSFVRSTDGLKYEQVGATPRLTRIAR